MARVLFAWELGGGLGHLTRFKRMAEGLLAAGHEIFLAVRNLGTAHHVFGDFPARTYQAPLQLQPLPNRIEPPSTFAQILHNTAFGDADLLHGLTSAWTNLFDAARPDLVIFDHSPTALLAAGHREFRRVVIGNGFCCPALCDYFPDWRPWEHNTLDTLRRDEDRVTAAANRVLAKARAPQLNRLSDLYLGVDATILTTFPELDPFSRRAGVRYWGVWPATEGTPPVWPQVSGKRVLAYLKPSPGTVAMLDHLAALGLPTVAYVSRSDMRFRNRYANSPVRISDKPVDLRAGAQQCDLAVLNATLTTTAVLLLAGKPVFLLPTNLEQRLTAERVAGLGAGRLVLPTQVNDISDNFRHFIAEQQYSLAAKNVADRYAQFDSERSLREATGNVMRLLPEPSSSSGIRPADLQQANP